MLHHFLSENLNELTERCRNAVARRDSSEAGDAGSKYGIPLFLMQLIGTLQRLEQSDTSISHPASGSTEIIADDNLGIRTGATLHGKELFERGYSIENIVHDYGDLCQAITGLAAETGTAITVAEFKAINLCLDDAIADAVAEFSKRQQRLTVRQNFEASTERLGFLAHELRNQLHTATLALSSIKSGKVGLHGATGALLDHSLAGVSKLIDQALTDVRLSSGSAGNPQYWAVADFIADLAVAASLEAGARGCKFTAAAVDATLGIIVDRDLLMSAVTNLLQNAFKFTRPGTEVSIRAYALGGRVFIEVSDHCGGLPKGAVDTMFEPFTQNGHDRSGLGLGLSIARKTVEASDGELTVRDVPGIGCTFTVNLPLSLLQR